MFFYGKTAANAISAMSYLAERYQEYLRDGKKVSSADISQVRTISKPLVAKLLTQLSQAGLVKGSTGPGGGYYLVKAPAEIFLFDIVMLYERVDDVVSCPFGEGWCGNNEPCPLHNDIVRLKEEMLGFLKNTSLGRFEK